MKPHNHKPRRVAFTIPCRRQRLESRCAIDLRKACREPEGILFPLGQFDFFFYRRHDHRGDAVSSVAFVSGNSLKKPQIFFPCRKPVQEAFVGSAQPQFTKSDRSRGFENDLHSWKPLGECPLLADGSHRISGSHGPKAEAQSEPKARARVDLSQTSSGGPLKPTTASTPLRGQMAV